MRLPPAALVAAAVTLLLLVAAPAQGAEIFVSNPDGGPDEGVFVGGDETGELLFLSTPAPGIVRVRASGGTSLTTSEPDCTWVSNAEPTYDCAVDTLAAEVSTLGESDIVDVSGPIPTRMYGGDGNDVLRGGSAVDYLGGEGGNDQLFGRDGDDDLRGDDGDDQIDGEGGSDLAIGGLGKDTMEDTGSGGVDSVTYKLASVASGVRVTVGSGADDGRDDGLEGDNVKTGFERIQGSDHGDVLRGSGAAETINGSGGNDDIDGGGGADTIEGNGGDDVIRAQDGVADASLDCDAASDPSSIHGTADVAFIDAIGTDPDPRHCETVTRTGAGTGDTPVAPAPAPPRNTARPAVLGAVVVGKAVTCAPGEWTHGPSFTFSWYLVNATGGARKVGEGSSYTPTLGDAPHRLACVVVATTGGQTSAAASPLHRVAALPVPAPAPLTRRFPDFVDPAKQDCGRGYCEADEVRQRLGQLGFPMTFRVKAVAGLRTVPSSLRKTIRPGQVFRTTPKPKADVRASLGDPLKVTVRYYVPNPSLDCPIGETVEVRGGRDYTFNELLVGLSLRDAVKLLKREGCSQSDYEVDYRYRKGVTDPVVSRSRTVDDTGSDQVRLTVDHPAPDLQINFVGAPVGDGRLPLRLDDTRNRLTFVKAAKQVTDFTVHVATRAGGVGFKRLRVELRDPGENLAAVAFTDGEGRARFSQAKIGDDGTYELWASHTDTEGDALVGWKAVDAVALKSGFSGYDGKSYTYADKRFAPAARAASARATAAADGVTLAEMRRQATRVSAGLAAFRRSAAGQAQINSLTAAEMGEVGEAYNALNLFGQGVMTLDFLQQFVRPSLATLGGTQTLGIGPAPSVGLEAVTIEGRTIGRQSAAGIQVGPGAMGFVTTSGATLFADGSFFMQTAGGNGFKDGAALGRIALDVTRGTVAIDNLGPSKIVGIISGGAGNIISGGAGNLIATDGSSIISGGGGNIISGGGGNIVSSDGASIISGGAGNLIGQDGAGLIGQDGAGLIGQDGAG